MTPGLRRSACRAAQSGTGRGALGGVGRPVQPGLQRLVAERLDLGPVQPGRPGPAFDAGDGPQADPQAARPPPGGSAPGSTSVAGSRGSAAWIVARPPSRPFLVRERTARWTIQRRCRSGARSPGGRVACSRSPIYVFTMPIWCSPWTDPGVHVAPIQAFTLDRSGCSPWTETRSFAAEETREDEMVADSSAPWSTGMIPLPRHFV